MPSYAPPKFKLDFTNPSDPSNTPYELVGGAKILDNPPDCSKGRALRIAADKQYAKVPGLDINPSKMPNVTISLGVYLVSMPNNRGWLVSHDNGGFDRAIFMHEARANDDRNERGRVSMGITRGSGWGRNASYHQPRAPPIGKWVHVVGTWVNQGMSYFYIDGVRAEIGNIDKQDGSAYPDLHIGCTPHWSNHHTDCWVDGLDCFDYAMNEAQVKELYDNWNTPKNGKFSLVVGKMQQVDVSHCGNHVWGCTVDNKVYYRPGVKGDWQELPGLKMKWVAVSAGDQHVYGVTPDNTCFYRAGGLKGEWKQIAGYMNQISVSANGEHVWGVLYRDDCIFYRHGGPWEGTDGWRCIDGCKGTNVSVSANGDHVWVVKPDGTLALRVSGVEGHWIDAGGIEDQSFVCVADGKTVWSINSLSEEFFQQTYDDGRTRVWTKQGAKLTLVSVSQHSKDLWGVDSNGDVWWYNYGA